MTTLRLKQSLRNDTTGLGVPREVEKLAHVDYLTMC